MRSRYNLKVGLAALILVAAGIFGAARLDSTSVQADGPVGNGSSGSGLSAQSSGCFIPAYPSGSVFTTNTDAKEYVTRGIRAQLWCQKTTVMVVSVASTADTPRYDAHQLVGTTCTIFVNAHSYFGAYYGAEDFTLYERIDATHLKVTRINRLFCDTAQPVNFSLPASDPFVAVLQKATFLAA